MAVDGEEAAVAAGLVAVSGVSVALRRAGRMAGSISVGNAREPSAQSFAALAETAYIFDQSDGRVVMRLSGPNVRRILAKGVAVDLHPSVFAIGTSSNVLCGHISVNLARTGENEFELIVMRSFAETLFDDLRLMGREFDLSADFSG